jgi:hypothetical protein
MDFPQPLEVMAFPILRTSELFHSGCEVIGNVPIPAVLVGMLRRTNS